MKGAFTFALLAVLAGAALADHHDEPCMRDFTCGTDTANTKLMIKYRVDHGEPRIDQARFEQLVGEAASTYFLQDAQSHIEFDHNMDEHDTAFRAAISFPFCRFDEEDVWMVPLHNFMNNVENLFTADDIFFRNMDMGIEFLCNDDSFDGRCDCEEKKDQMACPMGTHFCPTLEMQSDGLLKRARPVPEEGCDDDELMVCTTAPAMCHLENDPVTGEVMGRAFCRDEGGWSDEHDNSTEYHCPGPFGACAGAMIDFHCEGEAMCAAKCPPGQRLSSGGCAAHDGGDCPFSRGMCDLLGEECDTPGPVDRKEDLPMNCSHRVAELCELFGQDEPGCGCTWTERCDGSFECPMEDGSCPDHHPEPPMCAPETEPCPDMGLCAGEFYCGGGFGEHDVMCRPAANDACEHMPEECPYICGHNTCGSDPFCHDQWYYNFDEPEGMCLDRGMWKDECVRIRGLFAFTCESDKLKGAHEWCGEGEAMTPDGKHCVPLCRDDGPGHPIGGHPDDFDHMD